MRKSSCGIGLLSLLTACNGFWHEHDGFHWGSMESTSSEGAGGSGAAGAGGGSAEGGGGAGGSGGAEGGGGAAVTYADGRDPAKCDDLAVLTHHNNQDRTGANLCETELTVADVDPSRFGQLFARPVDGQIYTQPLYVPGLTIDGRARSVVYVATEHNTVYAFDAADPAATEPIWAVNLGDSVPSGTIGCEDISPEYGITGTPVIDANAGLLYVVANTQEGGEIVFRLHALDLRTGAERAGGPVEIDAAVEGEGAESVGQIVRFDARQQHQRAALALANGNVYVAFGSHCDHDPWHGWLLAYDAATLKQTAVYNTTPDARRGAIWQAGEGPSVNAVGQIFAAVGNGTFDASPDVFSSHQIGGTGSNGEGGSFNVNHPNPGLTDVIGPDYGDSLIKLGPSLEVIDSFTPSNQVELESTDLDFGSTGPVLLTGTNLVVAGDKAGNLYVLDQYDLGGFSSDASMQKGQVLQVSTGLIYSTPVYWSRPMEPLLYVWPVDDRLIALTRDGKELLPTPVALGPATAPYPGGALSLSANGYDPATGILWASEGTGIGVLHAYAAADVSNELWNSDMNQARDGVFGFVKFNPPTVANGRVYLATQGALRVYGRLP